MNGVTIKWRIMLYHTIMLVFLLVATLLIMYLMFFNYLYAKAETILQSEAGRISEVLKSGNDLNLAYIDEYAAVFSNKNELMYGEMPQGLSHNSQTLFNMDTSNNQKWLVYNYRLSQGGENACWLVIAKSLDEMYESLNYFKFMMCIIIPAYILIAFIAMLCGGFLKQALSPVNQITQTAKQVSQGDFAQRIRFEGPHDEVGMLAETFNEMLDRLEDSFNREKSFSSEVSHELRTPVTAIIVNAEEALSGNKTTEEYKNNLQAILSESQKMKTLISQLLMMARSNDGKYNHQMELIDISLLTKTVIDELSEGGERSDISISADLEPSITMLADQTLYMRLVINLIENALKYNIPGGWVKVSLRKNENSITLSVADGGIGISEEKLPMIWDRFFKAEQSSIDSSPGLGLSIVKWIANLHGGTVYVDSELGKGSLFEIRFLA